MIKLQALQAVKPLERLTIIINLVLATMVRLLERVTITINSELIIVIRLETKGNLGVEVGYFPSPHLRVS